MAQTVIYRVRVMLEPRIPLELLDERDVAHGVPGSQYEFEIAAADAIEARRAARQRTLMSCSFAAAEDYRFVTVARRLPPDPVPRPRRFRWQRA